MMKYLAILLLLAQAECTMTPVFGNPNGRVTFCRTCCDDAGVCRTFCMQT